MKTRDKQILRQILNEVSVAEQLLQNIAFADFEQNEEKKRAVAMTVINVGELAKHLSGDFYQTYSVPDLQYAARTRDVYAHGYATLSFEMVYKTAKESLPKLRVMISKIL